LVLWNTVARAFAPSASIETVDASASRLSVVACVETDVETGEIFLPMGRHPAGFILYTPDGYMSA
jgi:hypothetical protein